MGMRFHRDKEWSDSHADEIARVVRRVAPRLIHVTPTSPDRDVNEGADYDIIVPSSAIACRIRRQLEHRDLTMTTHRPSGATPEAAKLRNGSVRWCLYAWAADGRFVDWMFLDLDVVRREGLIENAPQLTDREGSRFLYVPFAELDKVGAVVESTLRNP